MSARSGQAWFLGLVAWCAGVALQLQQETLWDLSVYAALASLACGAAWWIRCQKPTFWLRPLALGCVLVSLSFAVTGLHALSQSLAIDPALEGQDLDVVGVVQAMPQRQDVGWRFRFRIEQAWWVDKSGQSRVVDLDTYLPSQVYLGWYGQDGTHDSGWNTSALPEPVKAGERWRLRVRLKAPHGNLNPRGFDYELWLWEQGIRAVGYVRTSAKDPPPLRLANTWAHPVEAWRQSVRDRLLAHLSKAGSDAEAAKRAGIVAALVTGDQAAIDRSDWDIFRATGVSHLMSISGLHVTMFAWLASGFVAWAWRRSALRGFYGALHWPAPHVGALSGLVLAGFYALFSGWGVPAQRTLLMLLVVVLLRLSARQWHGALVWLTACAVVLTWDPWALLQPGFWLSFVAVGVLMASGSSPSAGREGSNLSFSSDPVQRTHEVPGGIWHRSGAFDRPVWIVSAFRRATALLREQAVVTLALAPLTILFFGQVSLVGLLANLLAIPWVTLLVTPLALLGMLWPDAWHLASWVLQPMSAMLGQMAAWPLASVSTAMPPWGLAILALVGALIGVTRWPWSWKCMGLPLLWPVLFWTHPRPAPGTFELLAADVGQGNAVLVRTATHSLLYDAGPRYSAESDAGHRVLVPLLAQMGERIDTLMLSHRDSDHTGGAAAVLAMHPQAALWSSMEEAHPLHAQRPGWTRCEEGQSWVWDGVRFEVLHPPAPKALPKMPKPNEVSCVLRIGAAVPAMKTLGAAENSPRISQQGTALLAGDIEAPQELALVQAGLSPVDVLLVPHHGSKTSSSAVFLEALRPRWGLLQAGYRNRYGHPAPVVKARYQELGIELVDSARCGAATWRSDAPDQVQCERTLRRRYWHHLIAP
jgi:competence protein ComEC